MGEKAIDLLLSHMIMDAIDEHVAFKWEPIKEPCINSYTGRVSYDYSGEAKKMTKEDLKEIEKTLGGNNVSVNFDSKLAELLGTIHINSWTATYTSNFGKHWISFRDLVEEKYNEWKHANFELSDEEGEEINEELAEELDDLFFSFLRDTSHEIYLAKLLKKME
ncbi:MULTISPECIES: hypothetical protein [Bacillus]|uniref:hypothetical protein n=1 Tax=Bacillus TaxID=1386 RepID=UPI00032EC770|nr:hypothetical protein [Bacillus pseudomycoides]EOP60464.1 hypothetical protein IIW_04413 [Bacillus cereus VD136]EOP70716.1 hypothetical protein KOW_04879 [Bacillus cereus VDM006]EOQ05757.1 hypothetical protein KOY_04038 [Bacillus cereus VDM021]OOG91559.1 hypothetical protein BTH41_01331 [Bacillus mycoides]MDF2086476.1 hypothetical protein [Bacillus pseudomycoides]